VRFGPVTAWITMLNIVTFRTICQKSAYHAGETAMPGRLHARLCHAFLVV